MSTDSLQECAFSLCHVTSRGTHCARRALFPDHSPTNDLDVSCSASNVVQQPKDKFDVDNLLVHQTFVETLAVMMTCSSPTNIRVLSPPLQYIYHAHTIIMHVLLAPSWRQHLQWCLVEDTACPHHRRYRPSKSSLHLLGGSAVTRPHHCQLQ